MTTLLVAILAVTAVSLIFNVGYIVHELGWFPHTKDRSRPVARTFSFRSRYERDILATHDFQVLDPLTDALRRFGHPEIYKFTDPYEGLKNVIRRYEEKQTRSRYDDLIHLPNYICNHVKCDDRINKLIGQIHELIHSKPLRSA